MHSLPSFWNHLWVLWLCSIIIFDSSWFWVRDTCILLLGQNETATWFFEILLSFQFLKLLKLKLYFLLFILKELSIFRRLTLSVHLDFTTSFDDFTCPQSHVLPGYANPVGPHLRGRQQPHRRPRGPTHLCPGKPHSNTPPKSNWVNGLVQ